MPPNPRSVRSTARSAARAPCPRSRAVSTIWASRAGRASARMAWPIGVMRSPSNAPRFSSRAFDSLIAGAGGASRKVRLRGSATPQAAQSSTRPVKSASRISGGAKASSAAVCSARHRRRAMPGSVRPARPARWSTAARAARTVSSRVRPVDGSNFGSRARPLSMTTRTPSMVMDVSAMDVARTTLRLPCGAGRIAAS